MQPWLFLHTHHLRNRRGECGTPPDHTFQTLARLLQGKAPKLTCRASTEMARWGKEATDLGRTSPHVFPLRLDLHPASVPDHTLASLKYDSVAVERQASPPRGVIEPDNPAVNGHLSCKSACSLKATRMSNRRWGKAKPYP